MPPFVIFLEVITQLIFQLSAKYLYHGILILYILYIIYHSYNCGCDLYKLIVCRANDVYDFPIVGRYYDIISVSISGGLYIQLFGEFFKESFIQYHTVTIFLAVYLIINLVEIIVFNNKVRG